MNQRPPSLRQKKNGSFFVRWGGKDHYLSSDPKRARELYLEHLARWSEWRKVRNTRRLPPIRSECLNVAQSGHLFVGQRPY